MKRACMIVHSSYPADPRVRRESEALLADGWAVDVICLRDRGQRPRERCDGAQVYRMPLRRHRGRGLLVYLLEYLAFFALASLRVGALQLQRRYDLVQVHNMPDFLVFTALLPRLLGARVVLDIHDLVPELYMLKFGGSAGHPVVRLTRWMERRSTAFADHVLTAGEPFRRRLIRRGVSEARVTVVMNSADPQLFRVDPSAAPAARADDTFTLIYHGGLFERYGLDIAIRAVDRLRDAIPGLRLVIYGQGEAEPALRSLIAELKLADRVLLGGAQPLDAIPALIRAADLGVVPYRQNPFTDLLYPTKTFEYLALGVPVVMARTAAVAELFGDVADLFTPPEDVDQLAERILALERDRPRLARLLQAAQRAYAPYSWERQRQTYVTLIEQLVREPQVALDARR
jgi:glycosyltransferase involved in cell wall biosynthesis